MKKSTNISLTASEERIMQILWEQHGAFLKDIIAAYPPPKPHQNTIATFLKIMVDKGYVITESYGRTYKYLPKIEQNTYSKNRIKQFIDKYFKGSTPDVVSFMVKEQAISIEELELLLKALKKEQSSSKK